MVRNRLVGFALVAGGALLFGLASPASAAAPDPTAQPGVAASTLVLSANPGERPSPSARHVVLTCEPTGGSHPDPEQACTQLAQVNGDFRDLNTRQDQACTLIYAPVTVTAHGFWRGRPVSYQETFPNECVLNVMTGSVFRF
ncbi:subtilase-type protease inhibitor [Streptoalloteichus hindustanus]|uniref:Subtilisin inhibitor-like n=1 Tax=Streptoalloteichus hindustanus TaxID=2017 RepID=A0A1M5BLX2_STRHI|nr:subtilase-type protease inhibitor [Streptoalloteichus hindustanus]SHF43603.1 Subtilisin inhibitor-like [Streptoalloteichus hindustanus]